MADRPRRHNHSVQRERPGDGWFSVAKPWFLQPTENQRINWVRFAHLNFFLQPLGVFLFCSIEECVERLLASSYRPLFVAVKLEQFGQRSPHCFVGLLRQGHWLRRPGVGGLEDDAGSLDHGNLDPPDLRQIEHGMCNRTSALKGDYIGGIAGDLPC